MGAHLLRRIAFIKARGEWPNSRLAQHLTRGIIAVITARFDRLELRLEGRWWPKSEQKKQEIHVSTLADR